MTQVEELKQLIRETAELAKNVRVRTFNDAYWRGWCACREMMKAQDNWKGPK